MIIIGRKKARINNEIVQSGHSFTFLYSFQIVFSYLINIIIKYLVSNESLS